MKHPAIIMVAILITLYSVCILMSIQEQTAQILKAVDSLRYDCAGPVAEEGSIFVNSYEEIDTTDYYLKGEEK